MAATWPISQTSPQAANNRAATTTQKVSGMYCWSRSRRMQRTPRRGSGLSRAFRCQEGPVLVSVDSYKAGDRGLAHLSAEPRGGVLARLADGCGVCIEAVHGLLDPAT